MTIDSAQLTAPPLDEPVPPSRVEPTDAEPAQPTESDPTVAVAPRLARGVVWSDVLAEMEQERRSREAW